MTVQAAPPTGDIFSFGPFRLKVSERLLTEKGTTVELGSRTLETLIALVSRPQELIGKRDLLALVWPDVSVDEGSLRFHIALLRKALGDRQGGARYITTVSGRGYCFVAPVLRSSEVPTGKATTTPPQIMSADFLPALSSQMVGRKDDILRVLDQLASARFVTIVGSGGIGKTTLAIAVAHELIEHFAGALIFADLGALSDPKLVAVSLAAMLGLSADAENAIPRLSAYLQNKRLLLILDTCEHLIEAVADLAARIFIIAPQVHILTTSREALRVEGECVHRLLPLACPPEGPDVTGAAAQSYPAIQLFLKRVAASGVDLHLNDSNAAIVTSICRTLGGVPLAIELVAGRVETYGLQYTASLLEQRLTLAWPGQRTAPERQRTLRATLDWSYGLLSRSERVVLRRLAVFAGHFTLEATLAVVANATIDEALVLDAVDGLISKSILATHMVGGNLNYRLLDTTRAYVLEIVVDANDIEGLAASHASYYLRWLQWTGNNPAGTLRSNDRMHQFYSLNNVRTALAWCFGVDGDVVLGAGLAAAAAPLFLSLSLVTECRLWSERAINSYSGQARGDDEEMHLQSALGMSLMFTRGNSEAARVALNRSLTIAEERSDIANQVQLLAPLHLFHARIGEFGTALQCAERISDLAKVMSDPAATALGQGLVGYSLHMAGDLDNARLQLEAAVSQDHGSATTDLRSPKFRKMRDKALTAPIYALGSSAANSALARTLWLQGHPDQAVQRVHQSVQDASLAGHPVTLLVAMTWGISVLLWTGDIESAEEYTDRLSSHAQSYSLGPSSTVALGFKGELAIRRGDTKLGIECLQDCLKELHATRHVLMMTTFNIALAQGLATANRIADAMKLVNEAIQLVTVNGDHAYMPELLRLKGRAFQLMSNEYETETCFRQSLELSHSQNARGWELRTATDMSGLLSSQGDRKRARALLASVLATFEKSSHSQDLAAARELLATLA